MINMQLEIIRQCDENGIESYSKAILVFIVFGLNIFFQFEIDNKKECERTRILGITTMKRVR